jgi:hypothetical protein
MKKSFLLIIGILALQQLSFAQDSVFLKREARKKVYTDRPPQAFYAEMGGAGLVFSVNYDRRFNKQVDGLGFRAGVGYSFTDEDISFTTIPLGINYLMGDKIKGRYFEMGLNESVMLTGDRNSTYYSVMTVGNVEIKPNSTYFVTSLNLGYRSQPTKGGFNFRIGLMPYLLQSYVGIGGYLSLGYNF